MLLELGLAMKLLVSVALPLSQRPAPAKCPPIFEWG
jgi:hypothetical protein